MGTALKLLTLVTVQKVYPSLERNIQKLKTKQEDCVTRSASLNKASKAAEKRYVTDCEKLGIDPEKAPKDQLVQSLVNLPSIVHEISENLTKLAPAIEYYTQYQTYTCGEQNASLINLKVLFQPWAKTK